MKTPSSPPRPKKSLAQQVAQQLQQQIESGRLTVGQKLPAEPELMKLYGVGRSTVREAVRMLLHTGVVSVQQGRGTFVLHQTQASESLAQRLRRARPEEALELLTLLEGMMARLAAGRHTDDQLQHMQQAVEQRSRLSGSHAPHALADAERMFYDTLEQAAGNSLLTDLHRALTDHCQPLATTEDLTPDEADDVQAMYENLVRQIGEGNAKKAAKAAQNLRASSY